jgi:hypothetical protein
VSDSLTTAAGMVIDAQGRVTYDFAGHVHAVGLDLDAGTGAEPPADRRVRWLKPNGDPAGQLLTYAFGTQEILQLLSGDDVNAGNGCRLSLNSDPAGTYRVFVTAGAQTRLLLDSAGNSDFL